MDRIYTGFESLDKHLKIYKGDLVVIGGSPAIGKTCLMCSMIEKIIYKQKTVFFAMQTTKHRRVERLNLLNTKENKNFYLYENITDFEEWLITIAEIKVKNNLDVVFICNFEDLLNCSNCSEKELILKIKNIALRFDVAIIVSDDMVFEIDRRYYFYRQLKHKEFIKYADKIITINRPDKMATEEELRDGWIEKNVAEISIDKDMEDFFSPRINLKFDNNSLTFNEIPKTP